MLTYPSTSFPKPGFVHVSHLLLHIPFLVRVNIHHIIDILEPTIPRPKLSRTKGYRIHESYRKTVYTKAGLKNAQICPQCTTHSKKERRSFLLPLPILILLSTRQHLQMSRLLRQTAFRLCHEPGGEFLEYRN